MLCCKTLPSGGHHLLCPNYEEVFGKDGGTQPRLRKGYPSKSLVGCANIPDDSDSEEDAGFRAGRRINRP